MYLPHSNPSIDPSFPKPSFSHGDELSSTIYFGHPLYSKGITARRRTQFIVLYAVQSYLYMTPHIAIQRPHTLTGNLHRFFVAYQTCVSGLKIWVTIVYRYVCTTGMYAPQVSLVSKKPIKNTVLAGCFPYELHLFQSQKSWDYIVLQASLQASLKLHNMWTNTASHR